MLKVGQIVDGKYRVERLLGQGGMGAVFEGYHLLVERRVAIKVLPTNVQDESLLKRFLREARATAGLQHPNIVRAHDLDHEDRVHFLVMDYVEGVLLHELVV